MILPNIKYIENRSKIKDGDIILVRNNNIVANTIKFCDKAYFTHVLIAMSMKNRLWAIDSNAPGVNPDFLSDRLNNCVDFAVLRINEPDTVIQWGLNKILDRAEQGIKYNFFLLPKIAITRLFGINFKYVPKSNKNICSEFVRNYTNFVGVRCYNFNNWITPQDFIRFKNSVEISVIVDYH